VHAQSAASPWCNLRVTPGYRRVMVGIRQRSEDPLEAHMARQEGAASKPVAGLHRGTPLVHCAWPPATRLHVRGAGPMSTMDERFRGRSSGPDEPSRALTPHEFEVVQA
jgi:hypothetical protein